MALSDNTNWEARYDASTPNETELSAVDNRRKQSRDIAKLFFGISILLTLISIAASLSSGSTRTSAVDEFLSTQSETSDTSSWDSSWVPAGFTAWSSDSNIAWKWADKNNCDNYGCISADFISRDGCPNGLYAALNWLDSNDVVVSYDNATLPSLLPLQTAKLRFDDVQELGKSGQMAEINCR
jgi:hypothetical protein